MPLLARTISLSLMHVMCKNIYQNPKGHEDTLLSLCCIDKTMSGWNLERVASICRERCGGQGFLANNKFGDYLSIAHAGLTAEGDNRVLMVKICKDMITNVTKKGHKLPQMTNCPFRTIAKLGNIVDLNIMLDLLKFRETMLFQKLVEDTKTLTKKVGGYQVLMRETSDVMQNLAMTYGERNTLEYCISQLKSLKSEANKKIMEKVFLLFAAEVINRDLSFYMLDGVVSKEAASQLTTERHKLIKDVAA